MPEHPSERQSIAFDSLLRQRLLDQGISEEEIRQAERENRLPLLAVETELFPARVRYTPGEAADLAGMDLETARAFWRAFGLPAIGDDEKFLTEEDVEVLRRIKRRLNEGVDPSVAMHLTRVVGSSLARIAEAEVSAVQSRALGVLPDQISSSETANAFVVLARERVAEMADLLEYGHRRHLAQAISREVAWEQGTGAGTEELAVGFADLVGFTALSQEISAKELADLVEKFEETAFEVITSNNGRVVKMIGDEVMYVHDDPAEAVEIGLTLTETLSDLARPLADAEVTGDIDVSSIRVGISFGEVLSRDADYYGPVVNLAGRIVNIAFPGSVLVSESISETLGKDERFTLKPIPPRRLKGIGRTPLWVARRPGEAGLTPIQRRRALQEAIVDRLADSLRPTR